MNSVAKTSLPEIAFYYPNPYWRDSSWAKNLILFFDGIGLLIPSYMPDHSDFDDQAVIAGLKEHGLFHVLRPETVVDSDATQKLATAMTEIIKSGALDSLAKENTAFRELSRSRLGAFGNRDLERKIFEELKAHKLAKDSEDGVSIPMHPKVRSLVLVLLAQILRPQGEKLGLDLAPATDEPVLVNALCELLSLPSAPSCGRVITFDIKTVGVDLGPFPIDEVLAFRKESFAEHREYSLAVRKFVRELGLMPAKEQAAAFEQRQADLDEIANELAHRSMKTWKTKIGFALGVAGAMWAYTTDRTAGILSGLATLFGAPDAPDCGSFSYLFEAKRHFPQA